MEQLHSLFSWVAAAGGVLLVAAAAVTATRRTTSYVLLDRAILVQLGTTALASATGLTVMATARGPVDPLHFVYGVVALVIAPATRYAARRGDAARMGRWEALAGVVVLAAVLRLFMTGR